MLPFQPNEFDTFHLAMLLLRDPNAAMPVLQPVRFTVDTFKITGSWLLWRKQGILSRPSAGALDAAITVVEYARFADDLVVLVSAHPEQRWLRTAVEKRLREEFAKLEVEVNEEKSRRVDLKRRERVQLSRL